MSLSRSFWKMGHIFEKQAGSVISFVKGSKVSISDKHPTRSEGVHPGIRLQPTIALLHSDDLIEDWLDDLGVSFEALRDELIGSWMFGYIDALRLVGVQTVLYCVSARITAPLRFKHAPTGATICVLPAPKIYRAIRRWLFKHQPHEPIVLLSGYIHRTHRIHTLFSIIKAVAPTPLGRLARVIRHSSYALFTECKSITSYLATPLGLLANELRRDGCSAILCQDYELPRFDACVLLGQLMSLPVFACFQGIGASGSRFECLFRPLSLQKCAGLIIPTLTEAQRVQAYYNLPSSKLARIFNPVDLAKWSPTDYSEARAALGIPTDAQVVVWHGNILIYEKGLDILLEVWDRICQERSAHDLRLLLIGAGRDVQELRQHIVAKQLRGVLWMDKWVHDRTEIRHYLSSADIFVFPSRHEGFPVAPLEAMACGLPVVAADASGITDILEGGDAAGGLVVPRGDPEALSLALGRVLDDKDWGRELGKRARRRVERSFSLEEVGKQLCHFLLHQEI